MSVARWAWARTEGRWPTAVPFRSPEFAIREARISAFAMGKNDDMRLPWYDSPTGKIVGLSHRGSRKKSIFFVHRL
jgi:hypothetical protein